MKYDYSKESIAAAKASFKGRGNKCERRRPFYNGKQKWIFNVTDEELFKDAIWEGYIDACRTFDGIQNTKSDRTAFNNLADSIQNYFNGGIFDHSKWSNKYIDDIKEQNSYDAQYGQAQKVINMAFKYLYCCRGAENFECY